MIEFRLPAMSCGHCERTVTETVKRLDAEAAVSVDLPSHTVHIRSALPRERFAEALAAEGYPPA